MLRRAAALLAAAALAAVPASAHVVYGRTSLAQLVAGADVVARARIDDAAAAAAAPDGTRRPAVAATLLEVIKGSAPLESVRFAQHGHGVAPFQNGEEALVFLLRAERAGELAPFAAASGLPYVSLQEHDDRWTLREASGKARLDAARGYARLAGIGDANSRVAEHRALVALQLASGDARLAASALTDLIGAPAGFLTRDDLAPFEAVVASPSAPIGVRVGLLAELERRGLVDGGPRWAALVRDTRGADRRAALRAVPGHPGPEVLGAVLPLLLDPDPELAAEAALALGAPPNLAAVGSLAQAVDAGPPRVRMAAIRALGRIGGPEARRVLEHAASAHPDATTRDRARAEAKLPR
jgi:HEAT repeat protein